MSDLTAFRDHARRMADSKPTDRIRADWAGGGRDQVMRVGEIPDTERALWRHLADEIDTYLAPPVDTDALFEEPTR